MVFHHAPTKMEPLSEVISEGTQNTSTHWATILFAGLEPVRPNCCIGKIITYPYNMSTANEKQSYMIPSLLTGGIANTSRPTCSPVTRGSIVSRWWTLVFLVEACEPDVQGNGKSLLS